MSAVTKELAERLEPLAWAPPTGMRVGDVGFVWDGETQQHTPKVVVYFESMPANSPANAKGWLDRDAFVAMLAAAPEAPQPAKREPLTEAQICSTLATAFPDDAEPDGSWKLAQYELEIFRLAERAHGIGGQV